MREKAHVTVTVDADGKPPAGAEIALAAVDEGLLELSDNASWNLLEAMLRERAWGVTPPPRRGRSSAGATTAARRCRPAAAAARARRASCSTRCSLWKPQRRRSTPTARRRRGAAQRCADQLPHRRGGDAGRAPFGTGSASIRATQDLQIFSGLPPLVREDDQFSAMFTLRNTTTREMKVARSCRAGDRRGRRARTRARPIARRRRTSSLAAGEAKEVAWPVDVPADVAQHRLGSSAERQPDGDARRAQGAQRIVPAVPLRCSRPRWCSSTARSRSGRSAGGRPARRAAARCRVQPRLAEGLTGVRDWFARYPYTCLEQKASKAIGLRDDALLAASRRAARPTSTATAWPATSRRAMATAARQRRLTAYLLAVDARGRLRAGRRRARDAMLDGLIAFVDGRIQREFWSPRRT